MRLYSPLKLYAARCFLVSSKGNFTVMIALILPFSITLTAFTITTAALYLERRHAQAVTDLAAIAAVGNIDSAEQKIASIFASNGFSTILIHKDSKTTAPTPNHPVITLIRGHYTPDTDRLYTRRFEPDKQPYNAVQISLHMISHLVFGDGLVTPPIITTRAVASNQVHIGAAANLPLVTFNSKNDKFRISIGEPAQGAPWLAAGEDGEVAWSAQARIRHDAAASPLQPSPDAAPLQIEPPLATRSIKVTPVLVQ